MIHLLIKEKKKTFQFCYFQISESKPFCQNNGKTTERHCVWSLVNIKEVRQVKEAKKEKIYFQLTKLKLSQNIIK